MSSSGTITVTPLATYRNERPYPFCPGCGHGSILDALDRALTELALPPERVVIVSDIGCSGLSDQYFSTSAFHGLHGRSLTYATGIKLARPELEVIVIMGDGGTGIGGAHLLSAARRNIGLTLLVLDNFNFGMTGGQHSTTTPAGAVTATTPGGNLEQPLDVCATAWVNGAAFAWRGTSFDADLADRIVEAIRTPGFAVLDVWELCTAYYVPRNRMTKKALVESMEALGREHGLLGRREVREYGAAYRAACATELGKPPLRALPIEPSFASALERRHHLVVAGSAGGRVRSSVRLLAEAAVLSGLYAAQRDDYPITVQTGHSVSELVLAREPIEYAGGQRPDALVLLSDDGRKRAARFLEAMSERDRVYAVPEQADVATRAKVVPIELPRERRLLRTHGALMAAATVALELELFPLAALEEAIARGPERYQDANLAALRALGHVQDSGATR